MDLSDFTNVDNIMVQIDHLNGWVAAAAVEIVPRKLNCVYNEQFYFKKQIAKEFVAVEKARRT